MARHGPEVTLSTSARGAWGLQEAEVAALLGADPATGPAETLRRMPGRVTFRTRTSRDRAIVVKRWEVEADDVAPAAGGPGPLAEGGRTRRGRGLSEWLRRRLSPRNPWAVRDPAGAEHAALTALFELGVPVPEPLALARLAGPAGPQWGPSGVVVMALVPHEETLRQRLARAPGDAARFAPELAALVARLHGAGWYHRDLYLQHVAVETGSERLVLLDLARARWEPSPRRRWFVKDLGALAVAPGVDEGARCGFLEAYCDLRGIPDSARPAWARAILARARRIARHVPRHEDPATREGGL